MDSQDGISNTFTIVPSALGKSHKERVNNLVSLLDGYTMKGGFHLNVNVFDKELLLDSVFKNIDIGKFVFIRLSDSEWMERNFGYEYI